MPFRRSGKFSIPNGRGSMGGKSRMDYPRLHVAAGTRQRDRHSWDEDYSLLLTK